MHSFSKRRKKFKQIQIEVESYCWITVLFDEAATNGSSGCILAIVGEQRSAGLGWQAGASFNNYRTFSDSGDQFIEFQSGRNGKLIKASFQQLVYLRSGRWAEEQLYDHASQFSLSKLFETVHSILVRVEIERALLKMTSLSEVHWRASLRFLRFFSFPEPRAGR